MGAFAADVVRRPVAGELAGMRPLALAAYTASAVVTLTGLFGLGMFPLQGHPGPADGDDGGRRDERHRDRGPPGRGELRKKTAEVEIRLALGLRYRQAPRAYLSAALRTALIPQVATTKALGLVFLPGAMTGPILAGVDPLDAVLVQGVIMFMVLGAAPRPHRLRPIASTPAA
jgi:putative ABC transport system permease protein